MKVVKITLSAIVLTLAIGAGIGLMIGVGFFSPLTYIKPGERVGRVGYMNVAELTGGGAYQDMGVLFGGGLFTMLLFLFFSLSISIFFLRGVAEIYKKLFKE